MGETVAFYGFAILMLASAVVVICARSPITSLLCLLLTMMATASLFVLLGAYFLAALQLLIYAGAVLVLFLFAFMLLNLDHEALMRANPFSGRWVATGCGLLLCLHIGWIFTTDALTQPLPAATPESIGTLANVGRVLFRDYLLPFELTSLVILAAIIGAVALAQRKARD